MNGNQHLLQLLKKITAAASSLFILMGALGLSLMTLIIGWHVFARYVLKDSPNWSEQAALVLMIWYVCFAAAAGVREGFHIRIVALENSMPPGVQKIMQSFGDITVAICGIAMLIWSSQLVAGTWAHNVPTLGIPRGAVYLVLPLTGALIFLFSLERLLERLLPNNQQESNQPQKIGGR